MFKTLWKATRVLDILWIKYPENKCLIVYSCICGKKSDNYSRQVTSNILERPASREAYDVSLSRLDHASLPPCEPISPHVCS